MLELSIKFGVCHFFPFWLTVWAVVGYYCSLKLKYGPSTEDPELSEVLFPKSGAGQKVVATGIIITYFTRNSAFLVSAYLVNSTSFFLTPLPTTCDMNG